MLIKTRAGCYEQVEHILATQHPYDVPEDPELRVETENVEVDNCAHQVLLKLESMGLIKA